jgi:uncharacterized membrane protein YgdD (TMEM256/DUF423 family)
VIRTWLVAAAIGGLLSVIAGAVAAHLAAGERTTELLRTGALYGMVHAAALIGLAALAAARTGRDLLLAIGGWSFAAGLLLFSLSLFGLALSGAEWLALATPFGGAGLLVGWGALGLHALRRRRA